MLYFWPLQLHCRRALCYVIMPASHTVWTIDWLMLFLFSKQHHNSSLLCVCSLIGTWIQQHYKNNPQMIVLLHCPLPCCDVLISTKFNEFKIHLLRLYSITALPSTIALHQVHWLPVKQHIHFSHYHPHTCHHLLTLIICPDLSVLPHSVF